MTNQKKAYLFAILSVLCWSTVATAFKLALQHCDFLQLLFLSSLVSCIVLFVILLFQRKLYLLKTLKPDSLMLSLLLGFLNPFLYYTILFKAYSILPAQEAMTLNYTWPVMLVLMAIPLLKQKLTLKSSIAVLLSFAGIFIISSKGHPMSFSFSNASGDALAVGSSVIWALFWLFNVKDRKDGVIKLFLNFLSGSIFSAILMFIFSDFSKFSIISLPPIIYIGIFEMSVTFVFWLMALKYTVSTDKVSQLIFLSPFLSLVFIHFIVGESIAISTFIGLIFITLGIIIQQTSFLFLKKN
ncbi:MAG: DMT family transporter [Bacteroidetes bacterium]|nr:DMT family transporter [Bacteroidota bacterium]